MPREETMIVSACRKCDAGKSPVDIPDVPCGHERDRNAVSLSMFALGFDGEELEDLVDMLNHFKMCTRWVEYEERKGLTPEVEGIIRKRKLATEVITLVGTQGALG